MTYSHQRLPDKPAQRRNEPPIVQLEGEKKESASYGVELTRAKANMSLNMN